MYVDRLMKSGAPARAEEVLSNALSRQWRPAWVALYGILDTGDPAQRLRRAEKWLGSHGDDRDLLLALGRLSRRCSLWGKARQYLETCVSGNGSSEALDELALTLEAIGERDEALKYYRRAANARRDGGGVPAEDRRRRATSR